MNKLIYSKINYKWSDCIISHFDNGTGKSKDMVVTMSYLNEVVCQITGVKNYTEIITYINCMFKEGKMYSKISFSTMKKLFMDTYKSNFHKKEKNENPEELDNTDKSVKITNEIIEKTLKVVKRVKSFIQNMITIPVINDLDKKVVYYDPIPNLRFNL